MIDNNEIPLDLQKELWGYYLTFSGFLTEVKRVEAMYPCLKGLVDLSEIILSPN